MKTKMPHLNFIPVNRSLFSENNNIIDLLRYSSIVMPKIINSACKDKNFSGLTGYAYTFV